jgi:hypothetical protein
VVVERMKRMRKEKAVKSGRRKELNENGGSSRKIRE